MGMFGKIEYSRMGVRCPRSIQGGARAQHIIVG